MKTIEIIGYRRANLGKSEAQQLRTEGNLPCVLYGSGGDQIHFYSPMILFRDLVYTNEAHFVHLNIEGEECQAILQDIHFHPVSEMLLHADFLRIQEDRKIKMKIPARLVGQAPGVSKGGALIQKRTILKVTGFPKDMPDHIDVDVSELDFHHAIKVSDMKYPGLEFLDPQQSAVAAVEVPRAAKLAAEEAAAKAAQASASPAEGAAPAAAAGGDAAKKEGGKK
ncbi:MAG: 50S ribosomal protein L25/general stress protein Ctc [Cyclobacteriaceae bacterium]